MRKYVTGELFTKSGFIKEESIKKHIEQQSTIDELLPESASFFYVVETPAHKYHFMGKQQVNVSGYTNEEFLEKGVELFLQRVHPEEVDIVLNQIYPDYVQIIVNSSPENRKEIQFQYNYRFKRKDGKHVNLMEQLYALEFDKAGRPALILGNVIILGSNDRIPIRATAKLITDSGFSEIIFSKTYNPSSNDISGITDRELDILRNLATGKTSKQIGVELYISPHTVDTHRRNLLNKLNCHSVVELAQFAFRNGLL